MITYDYYRIFYYVAQYKSFTKAARALHNNQPNITRCMNNLEQELKCTLFLRSNKGIALTPEGRQLYEHVALAFEQLSIGEEEIRQNGELEHGLVSIGASENALRLILLEKLELFREKLRKKSLLRYREILVCGSKYKDLTTAPISIHELQDLPFVGLAEGTSTREMYMNYFMENRVSFHPDIEAATTDQVLPMIVHNLGIGFYPEPLAREVINDGKIFALQLKEPLPQREVCLVTNSSTAMSTAVKKAIEFIV